VLARHERHFRIHSGSLGIQKTVWILEHDDTTIADLIAKAYGDAYVTDEMVPELLKLAPGEEHTFNLGAGGLVKFTRIDTTDADADSVDLSHLGPHACDGTCE
jgi:hypothetical protein